MSLFNWIWGWKPLDEGQYDFLYHRDDFISLTASTNDPFDEVIETSLNHWPKSRVVQVNHLA